MPVQGNSAEKCTVLKESGVKDLVDTEQMASLKLQIVLLKEMKNNTIFHFAGSRAMEGVTTIVANLAQLLAKKSTDKSILLIDGNSKNPSLHRVFGVSSNDGFCDVLREEKNSAEVIHQVYSSKKLYLMPYGSKKDNGLDGVGQKNISDLLCNLKTQYDYILIDSPPILEHSMAISFAVLADTTILVAQAYSTAWEVVRKAKDCLEKNNCNIGGVVLNRVRRVIPEYLYRSI